MQGPEYRAIVSVADEASSPLLAITKRCAQFVNALTGVEEKAGGAERKIAAIEGRESAFHHTAEGVGEVKDGFGELHESVAGVGESIGELLPMFAGLGAAASVGGLVELVNKTAEARGELGALATSLGLPANQLQNLQLVAQATDVPVETVARSITHLNLAIGEAASGQSKIIAKIFQHAGISLRDANGHLKSATELLPELSAAFQKTHDPAMRSYIAMELMGRSGAEMLPVLTLGKQKLADLTAQAQKLNYQFSDEDSENLEKFHQAWIGLGADIQGFEYDIGAKLAPAIEPVVEQMEDWVAANRDWIATDIATDAKELAGWIKSVDWAGITHDVRDVWDEIDGVVKSTIGWKDAIEGLMGLAVFSAASPFLIVAGSLAKLTWETGKATKAMGDDLVKAFRGAAVAGEEAGVATAGAGASAAGAETAVASGEAALAAGSAGMLAALGPLIAAAAAVAGVAEVFHLVDERTKGVKTGRQTGAHGDSFWDHPGASLSAAGKQFLSVVSPGYGHEGRGRFSYNAAGADAGDGLGPIETLRQDPLPVRGGMDTASFADSLALALRQIGAVNTKDSKIRIEISGLPATATVQTPMLDDLVPQVSIGRAWPGAK